MENIINYAYIPGKGLVQAALVTTPNVGWYFPPSLVADGKAQPGAYLVPAEQLLPVDCEDCEGTGHLSGCGGAVKECECLILLKKQLAEKAAETAPLAPVAPVAAPVVVVPVGGGSTAVIEQPMVVPPVRPVIPQVVHAGGCPVGLYRGEAYLGYDVYDAITGAPRPMLVGLVVVPQGTNVEALMTSLQFKGSLSRHGITEAYVAH